MTYTKLQLGKSILKSHQKEISGQHCLSAIDHANMTACLYTNTGKLANDCHINVTVTEHGPSEYLFVPQIINLVINGCITKLIQHVL